MVWFVHEEQVSINRSVGKKSLEDGLAVEHLETVFLNQMADAAGEELPPDTLKMQRLFWQQYTSDVLFFGASILC